MFLGGIFRPPRLVQACLVCGSKKNRQNEHLGGPKNLCPRYLRSGLELDGAQERIARLSASEFGKARVEYTHGQHHRKGSPKPMGLVLFFSTGL